MLNKKYYVYETDNDSFIVLSTRLKTPELFSGTEEECDDFVNNRWIILKNFDSACLRSMINVCSSSKEEEIYKQGFKNGSEWKSWH